MQFIDEARIYLKAGNGGNGCVSFRREKFIEFGGPNGGNGGRGGGITIKVDNNIRTLKLFEKRSSFKAENGRPGEGNNCYGASGKDIIIKVPKGAQLLDDTGAILMFDFADDNAEWQVLKGGRGGLGNHCFKSSINQAPRKATEGEIGEELHVILKLKLLSDVGLIGLPNVGKSTIVQMCTNSKTKIANYAFTTLKPALGIVEIGYHNFVIADLPGLIAGASEGRGLGLQFLKHVERCKVLLHVLSATSKTIVDDYCKIRREIENYSANVKEKEEVIVLNKVDLILEEDREKILQELQEKIGKRVYISSIAHQDELMALMETIFHHYFSHKMVENDFLKFSPI